MALGSRKEQQPSLWVTHDALPHSKGHAFYCKLNPLLREAGFDRYVELLCEPYYHDSMGRRGAATAAGTFIGRLPVSF